MQDVTMLRPELRRVWREQSRKALRRVRRTRIAAKHAFLSSAPSCR